MSSPSALPAWSTGFADPPASHRPMPFFVWNGEVSRRRITEVLEQYAARGCGGCFIHPRTGLVTDYLSDEWFELWGHALAESKRLGLECHIYDENSYPSGFAGGHVYTRNPFTLAHSLKARWVDGPAEDISGETVACFRSGEDGRLERCPPGRLRQDGKTLVVTLEPSPPRAFCAYYPPVDLTLPQTTRTFLETTHHAYARRFREAFGSSIKYCFTDEPNVGGRGGFRASHHLLAEFFRDHGYRLEDQSPALFLDTAESPYVRHDYTFTLNRLWTENFLRPVHDWCEQNGLQFTGHFWEHMWPDPGHQPSAMYAYRWMQAPGIDLLAFQFFPEDRPRTHIMLLSCKEVASVARQLGRERVLCETTGGGGYHRTPADFKPLTDFCQTYGINLINPHLSHQSLSGTRKYDWAHTFSDHSSWWEDYKAEADHEARVTWALTRGEEINRVLLLQPTTTAWLHRTAREDWEDRDNSPGRQRIKALRQAQETLVAALTDQQVDFDLGDELILEEFGQAVEGRLQVGRRTYDLLVLPAGMENLLPSTLALLERHLSGGGRILAGGPPPAHVSGRIDSRPTALAERHLSAWKVYPKVHDLVDTVVEAVPPRLRASAGHTLPPGLCWTRRDLGEGRTLHFFANPWTEPMETRLLLEGRSLVRLDTMDGSLAGLASEAQDNGGQCARLALPPLGHELWLSLPDDRSPVPQPPTPRKDPPLAVDWSFQRVVPNQLTLEYGHLEIAGRRWEGIHAAQANVRAWQEHGHPSDPWQFAIQFRQTIVERTYPKGSGLRMEYPFTVDESVTDKALAGFTLGVERARLYSITLNGTPLEKGQQRWWDEDMSLLSPAGAIRRGANLLVLEISPFHPLCELQPAYLRGDFSLRPAPHGFVVAPAHDPGFGDWRSFGLHLYPWSVAYHGRFHLPEQRDGLTVEVPEWSGSTLRLSLDGIDAGVIAWPPHRLTIRRQLEPGQHHLQILLRGNVRNAVGPYHSDGHPLAPSWIGSPVPQPAGDAYRHFPAGITRPPVMTPFRSS